MKHWHFEGRMPEGLSPANASPLQVTWTRFRARNHTRTRLLSGGPDYRRAGTIEDENGARPATSNSQPATHFRASPKGFHLLSWPFSNASGPGMRTPTHFRARPNARGFLAGPCGQVVNLRARVKHWHFEGRMPEGSSPANASPLLTANSFSGQDLGEHVSYVISRLKLTSKTLDKVRGICYTSMCDGK